jgi:hypothetical protein
MKKLLMWALLVLTILLLVVPLLAHAQVDSTGADEPGVDITLSPKEIVWMGCTSVGSFLVGLAIKRWPVLDDYSNRLIPYTIGILATVGYMVVMKVGFVEALLMAGASSYGAILVAEATMKKDPAPGGDA